MSRPDMVHFTEGGIWHGYRDQDYAREWTEELKDMLAGSNPRANAVSLGALVSVSFGEDHG